MRTINDVTNISLLDCVNKLADLNDSRTDVSIQYGIQSLSFYKRRKQLKLYIYNALFIRYVPFACVIGSGLDLHYIF